MVIKKKLNCLFASIEIYFCEQRLPAYIFYFLNFFFFLIYNFVCINFFIFIYQLLLFVKIYLFYFSVFLFFLWLFYNPDELKISSNSFKNLSDLDIKLLEKWSRWKYRGIKKEVYLFVDFIYDVKFFYKNLNHYKLLSTILVVFFIKIIFFTFFYIIFFFFLRLYFYFYKFLSSFFFKERYVISFNVTTPETCEFFFFKIIKLLYIDAPQILVFFFFKSLNNIKKNKNKKLIKTYLYHLSFSNIFGISFNILNVLFGFYNLNLLILSNTRWKKKKKSMILYIFFNFKRKNWNKFFFIF